MKYSLDAFEQLQDISSFIPSSYLHIHLLDDVKEELSYLNAAFAFLLDRNLFKENAGNELTLACKDSLVKEFDANKLSELALSLNNNPDDPSFLKGKDNLSTYYKFITETEEYVKTALDDEVGKLTLAYLNKLLPIMTDEGKRCSLDSLHVSEVCFLNFVYAINQILKGFYGPRFSSLKSFPFFDGVSREATRIRTEILD